MASVIKKHKAKAKLAARKKERKEELERAQGSPEKNSARGIINDLLEEMVATVEKRSLGSTSIADDKNREVATEKESNGAGVVDADSDLDPWLRNFNKRFKIEKAADLLLLYAKTGYFFSIQGYEQLRSSPIEVYARDLGNAVPASTIDRELLPEQESTLSSPSQSPVPEGEIESMD